MFHAQAQLSLAALDEGSQTTIAQAKAQVQAARARLKILHKQLESMVITAPFEGVIARVEAHQGQWVAPGEMTIEILDTSGWQIETKNVGSCKLGKSNSGSRFRPG